MKPTYEELEEQLNRSRRLCDAALAYERVWETAMMQACGEDGPKSVAEKFAALEAKCAALAAENAGLKAAAEFATAPDMWVEQADGMLDYRYCEWYVDVLNSAIETPATDAFLAEVRASGIDAWISSRDGRWNGTTAEAERFAAKLRKGGQS